MRDTQIERDRDRQRQRQLEIERKVNREKVKKKVQGGMTGTTLLKRDKNITC